MNDPHQTPVLPDGDLPHSRPTFVRLLERAREERGSPSLWDAVTARLDSEERQREVVAPMVAILDQIRDRVDDETWKLVLDFEYRHLCEVMAGVETGLELGYSHGRMSALVEVEAEDLPSPAATLLIARLVDLLGDSEAGHFDVLLALLTALQATVMNAVGEISGGGSRHSCRDSAVLRHKKAP